MVPHPKPRRRSSSDPTDDTDGGEGPNSENVAYVRLELGDPGLGGLGATDLWKMRFGDAEYEHPSGAFGVWHTSPIPVERGQSYPIEMLWVRTENPYGPDYDYRAWVYVVEADGSNPRQLIEIDDQGEPEEWWNFDYPPTSPVDGLYIHDPQELMGQRHDDNDCEGETKKRIAAQPMARLRGSLCARET